MSRSLFLFFLPVPILLAPTYHARISVGGYCPNVERPAHITEPQYTYLAQVLGEDESKEEDDKDASPEPAESQENPADTPSENTGDKKDNRAATSKPDQEKAPSTKADALTEEERAQKEADTKAFLKAAAKGDLKTIQSLVDKVDVNAGDNGLSALMGASIRGHIDIVRLLIKNDANVNQVGAFNNTPLHKHTPLHWLVQYQNEKDIEIAELLLGAGADMEAKNDKGYTPLHYAMKRGNLDLGKFFIAQGANINTQNNAGQTPLDDALKNRNKDLIEILFDKASDLNLTIRDKAGLTFFHYAVMTRDMDIVQKFIAADADINAKDNIGRTPLHFAISTGNTGLRDFLIERGAKTDIAPMQPGRKPTFGERAAIGSLGLAQQHISGDTGESVAQAVNLEVSINRDDITIYSAPEEQVYLHIKDLTPFMRIGEPQLPMKTFMIKLPLGSEVVSVEVTEGQFSTIEGNYRIIAGQQDPDKNYAVYHPNEDSVYDRHAYYPGEWVKYETGKDNNNTYVFVRFYPVQYLPPEGKLVVATEAKLRVHYRKTQEILATAYAPDAEHTDEQKKAEEAPLVTNAPSVIVVPEELLPAAQKLKDFHEKQLGISTTVVTIESINARYTPAEEPSSEGYANTELKDRDTIVNYDYALARKIISYLRDTATHPELEYVTIVGDAGLVPASYMFFTNYYDYNQYAGKIEWGATDFFYTSPDYDFVPNYKVGRLPVNNNKEARAMVEKIERWHEHVNQEWFRKAYIHAGVQDVRDKLYNISALYFNNHLMEHILTGMPKVTSFFSEGLFTHERLQTALRNGHVGFVMLFAHGSPKVVQSGPHGRFSAKELMTYQRVNELPIVFTLSCSAAVWYRDNLQSAVQRKINHQPTFGEAILKSPAGGIALLGQGNMASAGSLLIYYDQGNVKLGKYTFSGEITYHALKSYHEGADTLGALAYDSIFDFVAANEMDFWINRSSVLMTVFLGDPALKIPAKIKTKPEVATKPESSQKVSEPKTTKPKQEENQQPESADTPNAQPRAPPAGKIQAPGSRPQDSRFKIQDQRLKSKGQELETEDSELKTDKPETPANSQPSAAGPQPTAVSDVRPARIVKPQYTYLAMTRSYSPVFQRAGGAAGGEGACAV